jgi:hypothetical protein
MRKHVAREMLDKMLTGHVPEESNLRELMAVTTEGQFVDFKNGSVTDDRDVAKQVVRSYVTGFANADGGLLVIGVSDGDGVAAQRKITPTKRPGGATLDLWARSCLDDMAGQLVPFPRFQVLTVGGSEVLIVATARAPAMVPCHERGARVYYLRVGDSTKVVPDYLVSDLMLGRRAHPILQVRRSGKGGGVNGGPGGWALGFSFEVENAGFTPARAVRIGLITMAMPPTRRENGMVASEHLRTFFDVQPVWPAEYFQPVHLISSAEKAPDIAPFDVQRVVVNELIVQHDSGRLMRSAMYVMADGHAPDWYQLDWRVPAAHGAAIESDITRAVGERPTVGYGDWRPPEVD